MTALRERRFDEPGATLAGTGESTLLTRLCRIAADAARRGDVPVGPGDDGAIWRPPPDRDLVVSQDCLVEGVDFRREWIRPHDLGRRAMMVALSDLAGMGARPAYCLATLCAAGSTRIDDVLALQSGLCEAAAASGCAPLGGDVSDTSGPLVIDLSVAGTVAPGHHLRRGAGEPGDALVVTGTLGGAAAGLYLLERAAEGAADADARRWVDAHRRPVAALAEGEALVSLGVRCGGDVSDGLVVDAGRTAQSSGCGAELWLDALPVDASLRRTFPDDWPALALGGGEDFELLAAVAPSVIAEIGRAWAPPLRPLTVVGRLLPGSGVRLLETERGAELALPPLRARHYR